MNQNNANYSPVYQEIQVGGAQGQLTSLAMGTPGQLLTSNGSGFDPSYQFYFDATSSVGFLALNTADHPNVTGDNTLARVDFPIEIFVLGNCYNSSSSLFTAPVTGTYLFYTLFTLGALSSSNTGGYALIRLNGAPLLPNSYAFSYVNFAAMRTHDNWCGINIMTSLPLPAGAQASIWVTVEGSAPTVSIAGFPRSYFGAYLINTSI